MKLLPALLLFLAEAVGIYAELKMSTFVGKTPKFSEVLPLVIYTTMAGFGIAMGYYWMYKVSNSIWVPTIVSLGSIFIVEPIMIYFMFHEPLTPRTMVSLALIICGIANSLK